MTLTTLSLFGFNQPIVDYESFHYPGENNLFKLSDIDFLVEADWSNAAFLLVGGAIAGNVSLTGLAMDSQQGDKAIIEVLQMAHAKILVEKDKIKVTESDLLSFEFDATDCPDLFPPLVPLAANCNGVSKIQGVNRLLHKESNRAVALIEEFGKMNVQIVIEDDTMIITGGKKLQGTNVSSHNDHRIAMACAVAALKAKGITTIDNAEAVNKSYPNFWNDLQTLGVDVTVNR
jgi:3-phosphoshikimate 1-carboxyvinyltransferase